MFILTFSNSELFIIFLMIFVPIIVVVSYVFYAVYFDAKFKQKQKSYRLKSRRPKKYGNKRKH